MTTVLEDCTTEKQLSVVLLFADKRLNMKDIHVEMFPVSGVKCLPRKAVHNRVEKHGKRFADEEVEILGRKWLRPFLHF
jgi:hypothetical protein